MRGVLPGEARERLGLPLRWRNGGIENEWFFLFLVSATVAGRVGLRFYAIWRPQAYSNCCGIPWRILRRRKANTAEPGRITLHFVWLPSKPAGVWVINLLGDVPSPSR